MLGNPAEVMAAAARERIAWHRRLRRSWTGALAIDVAWTGVLVAVGAPVAAFVIVAVFFMVTLALIVARTFAIRAAEAEVDKYEAAASRAPR